MLTEDQLKKMMPKLASHPERFKTYYPLLVAALEEAKINTPQRVAAFLSQVAHESDEFRYMSEVWGPTPQQLRYDPPTTLAARLGNKDPGDGYKYRGAGPIQVTGRNNFRIAGKALGLDLEGHPEQAFTPAVGFRLAAWFWNSRKLNDLADKLILHTASEIGGSADANTFDNITLKINGGYNGKPQRDAYYQRACVIFR